MNFSHFVARRENFSSRLTENLHRHVSRERWRRDSLSCRWMVAGDKQQWRISIAKQRVSFGAEEGEGNPWAYLSQLIVLKFKRGNTYIMRYKMSLLRRTELSRRHHTSKRKYALVACISVETIIEFDDYLLIKVHFNSS